MSHWIKCEFGSLTEENMNLLLEHKIPGILVENFIDVAICQQVAERLAQLQFANYDHLRDIPVHQLGLCHNQFAHDDKSVYFSKRDQANLQIAEIYRGLNIDPVQLVLNAIESACHRKNDIFVEPGYGKYFAGAFRSFKGHGRLHADHAPSHIRVPWAVTDLVKQLSWNIYYCVYDSVTGGGETVIYDTIHTPQNDLMKVPGEYYFPYEVLESSAHIRYKPKMGDLMMFNTQNFHEVLGHPQGNRISQTAFFALTKDGSLNHWS